MTVGESGPVIRVSHVVAGYGDLVVLDDVSFDVQRGEVFIILGGSGCGKTTMMRQIIGLERQDLPELHGRPAQRGERAGQPTRVGG